MLPDEDFMRRARGLQRVYLESNDPMLQSGFSGGRERWIAERSPLVDAIPRDGDFLDVGCANGLLAHDVVAWAAQREFTVVPFGVDLGAGLVDLARTRLPNFAENFVAADAWKWEPDRQWTFVYSLLDLSPRELWGEWLQRLMGWVVPGGRLIVGSYGSRTPRNDPEDVAKVMTDSGLPVNGSGSRGNPLVTRFAWARR